MLYNIYKRNDYLGKIMNKLSFDKLLEELEDSSKQQKLHALEDGEFLSHFEVSQREVEELYTEIEGEKDGQAE